MPKERGGKYDVYSSGIGAVAGIIGRKGLKPYGLSMASGVSQTTIGDIKYLRNKSVSTKILYDLRQGFGIEIAEFFDSPLFLSENITD